MPDRKGERLLAAAILFSGMAAAQLTTGTLAGIVHTPDGRAAADTAIHIAGALGFEIVLHTDRAGKFSTALPYGQYRVANFEVFVPALATLRLDLTLDRAGVLQPDPCIWVDTTQARNYPEPFSLQGLLLAREPATVTDPLDFTGLGDHRLPLVSRRGMSWTDTQFKLNSIDATDSYQPGRPVILPNVEALTEVSVRTGVPSYGSEVGMFLADAGSSWHATLGTANTGAPLAWSNLPPLASRGLVQQPEHFQWFTRDGVQAGGPITRRADVFASATGQWSSQTVPLAAPGTDQGSRLLFADVRGRFRATHADQFDALYSGSRINLTNFGTPVGLEAWEGRAGAPSLVLPGGFQGQSEIDHMDFLQAGWTHQLARGAFEARYGYSTAHFDTNRSAPAAAFPQSRIELLDGAVTGAPPLENLATRTRQTIDGAWQSQLGRHRLIANAGWTTASPLNRITAPSDMNLITADGAPAFVLELNTPLNSRSIVRSFSTGIADHIDLPHGFSFDAGALADLSRGSLPGQSSGSGVFAPPRTFAAQPDLIAWNSVSPRAAFAWAIPRTHGLTLRGAYSRWYAPLSGRELDFGNPNSLGGSEYTWIDRNGDGQFQTGELGPLIQRFGGPYSSIDPSLHRPYADEFDAGAEYSLTWSTIARVRLFRRDEKHRLAAIDVGVPFSDYTPVAIVDGQPVYSQNPATFGADRYLLTNPSGLRALNDGYEAEVRTRWKSLMLAASFVGEKSWGATNPGDAAMENDPGVIGALYQNSNTLLNATGRSYFDRGYVGKAQAAYRLPWRIEVATVATYLDGLAFTAQMLVTGLAQGPIVVPATLRGSPQGGNRAEFVANWNLRVQRTFGRFSSAVDVLNVTNFGQSIQQSDIAGPNFLLRLPVAIQEPRSVRLLFRIAF